MRTRLWERCNVLPIRGQFEFVEASDGTWTRVAPILAFLKSAHKDPIRGDAYSTGYCRALEHIAGMLGEELVTLPGRKKPWRP